MSPTLIALLCVDGALLLGLIVYVIIATCRRDKAQPVCERKTENAVADTEKAETEIDETAADAVNGENGAVEEKISAEEKPATEEKTAVEEKPAKKFSLPDGLGDDRNLAKRLSFAEKMVGLDDKTQSYYDAINNAFRALRKVNPRLSAKGVSYRLGRELVAKITVRGKTMRLHLALDVAKFPVSVYFQNDLAETKAYAEVPFTVKVKSDRGLKNALKLIDALAEEKSIEKKARYTAIDSLEELKENV